MQTKIRKYRCFVAVEAFLEVDWLMEKRSPPKTKIYLRVQIRALLHEGADREPKRVGQRELVFQLLVFEIARMRTLPFVRREPGHHKYGDRHQNVGREHVHPDIGSQRVHEREQARGRR